MRAKSIFWSDETWVDENTCARYNPQNDRKYGRKSIPKDSVSEELKKAYKAKNAGGNGAHHRVRRKWRGVVETALHPKEPNDGGRVLL